MHRHTSNLEIISILDRVRKAKGISALEDTFKSLLETNSELAFKLINDEDIQFTSLFFIKPLITTPELFEKLNIRNQCALDMVDKILTRYESDNDQLQNKYITENYPLLKWILTTGYIDDGLNEELDEVLEVSVIILVKRFKDKACLKILEEMIFNRNRNGSYTYDLIWAFFESSDAGSLLLLVDRLKSSNDKDVEFACNLLSFLPQTEIQPTSSNTELHKHYQNWINRNKKYLYYTGESNLQKNNPCRYSLSKESKYLQKKAYSEVRSTLKDRELKLLEAFQLLDDSQKTLLSDCSEILFRTKKELWAKWLRMPINKQIKIAKLIL